MGKYSSEIARLTRELSGSNEKTDSKTIECTVVSVNEEERTCVVDSESSNIDGMIVRLVPTVSDGDISIPEAGSTVMVAIESGMDPHIIACSFIDKKTIVTGNQMHDMQNGKQIFNSDNFGGFVKVIELTQKINTLEKDLNNFKDLFKNLLNTIISEPGNGAPSAFQAALKAGLTSYLNKKITETNRDDIENKSLLHGEKIS